MAAIPLFQQALWALNSVGEIVLLTLLVVRKNYRVYPAFFFYLILNLAMGFLAFLVYDRWGFNSVIAWRIFWAILAVLICARALAVTEICRHLLARYRGVWALAWRILLLCAALVLCYSILAARHDWRLALPNAGRGLELSIATVIVVLLLFARHYDVELQSPDRSLAVGFCLYSCFSVLNNTVLERLLDDYAVLWNLLGMLAFLASLSIWTWALRHSQSEAQAKEILLPSGIYQAIAPEINLRLRLFNEQLSRFWKVEAGPS